MQRQLEAQNSAAGWLQAWLGWSENKSSSKAKWIHLWFTEAPFLAAYAHQVLIPFDLPFPLLQGAPLLFDLDLSMRGICVTNALGTESNCSFSSR